MEQHRGDEVTKEATSLLEPPFEEKDSTCRFEIGVKTGRKVRISVVYDSLVCSSSTLYVTMKFFFEQPCNHRGCVNYSRPVYPAGVQSTIRFVTYHDIKILQVFRTFEKSYFLVLYNCCGEWAKSIRPYHLITHFKWKANFMM